MDNLDGQSVSMKCFHSQTQDTSSLIQTLYAEPVIHSSLKKGPLDAIQAPPIINTS
jgi:hypothetical protein